VESAALASTPAVARPAEPTLPLAVEAADSPTALVRRAGAVVVGGGVARPRPFPTSPPGEGVSVAEESLEPDEELDDSASETTSRKSRAPMIQRPRPVPRKGRARRTPRHPRRPKTIRTIPECPTRQRTRGFSFLTWFRRPPAKGEEDAEKAPPGENTPDQS